jgi:HD superfamily phosphohydrolase
MEIVINKRMKNFRVPVRDIKVKLHELLFINTYTFQRLYNIKQLGLAYLVYPFAVHTRAMHCLDCLDKAQRFIDGLKDNITNEKLLEMLKKDTDIIRAGALLHDISHIPFAHILEDENNLLERHDKNERIKKLIGRMKKELEDLKVIKPDLSVRKMNQYRTFSFYNENEFKEAIDKCVNLLEDVEKIIWTIALHDEIEDQIKLEKITNNTPSEKIFKKVKENIEKKYEKLGVKILDEEKYYISDIIGNTISADLLSYVLMDPEFAGTEERPGGWYRLFDYIHLIKDDIGRTRMAIKLMKKGEWRTDIFSIIMGILTTRYEIMEFINYHHAKLSAEAMLGKIAQFCNLSESDELYDISDEGFFELLKERIEDNKVREIKGWDKNDVKEGVRKLLENLRRRRLHKRFHIVKDIFSPNGYDLSKKYRDPEERLEFEKIIINKFGLKPGEIIIFCPKKEGPMKEAQTLVTLEVTDVKKGHYSWTLPLNDKECTSYLESSIGKSVADKIINIANQYEDLWKLYVFVDPTIIPIYGYAIKKELEKEFGTSIVFDRSYLNKMPEYELSEKFYKLINEHVIEIEKDNVFRYIPEVMKQLSTRGEGEINIKWLNENVENIVQGAIEIIRNPQRKLDSDYYEKP